MSNFRYRYNNFPAATALMRRLDDLLREKLGERQYSVAAIELDMTFWDTCGDDNQVVKALLRFARKYGVQHDATT